MHFKGGSSSFVCPAASAQVLLCTGNELLSLCSSSVGAPVAQAHCHFSQTKHPIKLVCVVSINVSSHGDWSSCLFLLFEAKRTWCWSPGHSGGGAAPRAPLSDPAGSCPAWPCCCCQHTPSSEVLTLQEMRCSGNRRPGLSTDSLKLSCCSRACTPRMHRGPKGCSEQHCQPQHNLETGPISKRLWFLNLLSAWFSYFLKQFQQWKAFSE